MAQIRVVSAKKLPTWTDKVTARYIGPGVWNGTSSFLANPFQPDPRDYWIRYSREEVQRKFIDWFLNSPLTPELVLATQEFIEIRKLYLSLPKSSTLWLVCWCHPYRCHGHFLSDLILDPRGTLASHQRPYSTLVQPLEAVSL